MMICEEYGSEVRFSFLQQLLNVAFVVCFCFVVIRIQNHEFQTAVYSSLALFEIYKLHIVSVSEK